MKVSVIGLGYIGLPTAALIASKDIEVIGVDVNSNVVDTINTGKVHIIEPGLEALVSSVVSSGYLRALKEPEEADFFIITVPTPFTDLKKPELGYVKTAIKDISRVLKKGDTLILESTSPVGTTHKILEWLKLERPDLVLPSLEGVDSDISIAYSPERVLPGKVLEELVSNERIIGGITNKCSDKVIKFYGLFVEGECLTTDSRTAELCKLVENSFRDVNIAFANELSLICDELDINVWELIDKANRHPRVNILEPGPGVGGHCIAVDPWFIVDSAPKVSNLIKTAREVNDYKPGFILTKIDRSIAELKEKDERVVIACLGLSFKPNIDDLRESPAINIVKEIQKKEHNELLLVEPNINKLPQALEHPDTSLTSLDTALERSNILILLVNYREFYLIDKKSTESKIVIDTKGVWSH